jgi:RNA polymerase sigma-70 factor (ECF subfamily)
MAATSAGSAEDEGCFEVWIEGAGRGSREEMGQLLEGCRQYLLMVANHALGPELQAKIGASDMVQETFLEAQEHFPRFRGRTKPELLTWLRRILECRLANTQRWYLATAKRAGAREVPLPAAGSRRERNEEAMASPTPSPSNHAIRNEWTRALEQALARLPEHHRQTVVWRHQEQLSFPEIGRLLGCSAEAARKLWSRAVHQLKRELESLS